MKVYTNVSNTCEQTVSNQGSVVGFSVSYHNLETHNAFYGRGGSKTSRQKGLYLGWLPDCELAYGKPTEWNTQVPFPQLHPYQGSTSGGPVPAGVLHSHEEVLKAREGSWASASARARFFSF